MTSVVLSVGLTLFSIACWIATVVGLPGNWIIVLTAVLLAWLAPLEWACQVNWIVVAILVGLASLGEIIEFFAGAAGVGTTGGTRRAVAYALIGSIVGAVAGLFVGLPIPIPLVGSLIGSVLLSGIGAAVGAAVGQHSDPATANWTSTAKVSWAAFYGRILGTVGKAVCGAVMVAITIWAVWT